MQFIFTNFLRYQKESLIHNATKVKSNVLDSFFFFISVLYVIAITSLILNAINTKLFYRRGFLIGILTLILLTPSSVLASTVVYGTISSDTTWTASSSPYILSGLVTIPAGNTLDIDPGVVVKFENELSKLVVNGTLNAVGAPLEKIYLTSYKDDSVDGDTNGDGDVTTPADGDWRDIQINESGKAVFSHASIQYGGKSGSGNSAANLHNNGGALSISDSFVANAVYGIRNIAGNSTITTSEIRDSFIGILHEGGNTTVSNAQLYNNFYAGVHNSTGIVIDAINNWWGDASGPYHPTLNSSGTGNRVSDNVNFEPWLITETGDEVPLYTQVESAYPSRNDTERWAVLNYANSLDENYVCGSSIRECGCAITSAVMIARYYDITETQGSDVNPGEINRWLQSTSGGYQNGDVNWLAIAKYTNWGIKYEKTDTVTDNYALLDEKLANDQPVIAKADSGRGGVNRQHFFVIDSKLASTYGVKDPYWYETSTLNEITDIDSYVRGYGNGFDGLRVYKKGDGIAQSAIMVALGSPAELLITDPQGRKLGKDENGVEYKEIPDAWYFEDGFDDPSAAGDLALIFNLLVLYP